MNRFSIVISMGGTIPMAKIEEMAKIIIRSGAGFDFGTSYRAGDEAKVSSHIRLCASEGASLSLFDAEGVAWTFKELREFLVANGMSYHEAWGSDAESGECNQWWEPGMASEAHGVTSNGEPCVLLSELEKALLDASDVDALMKFILKRTPIKVPCIKISGG